MLSKPIRVSPAMGVAFAALAFAVGGSSLAQGAATRIHKLISGSTIKKGSIPANRLKAGSITGKQIKAGSITGKQINEQSLGNVPSATRARCRATAR